MTNDFSAIPIKLPIFKNFDQALIPIKKTFGRLRTSFDGFGIYNAAKLVVNQPYLISRYLYDFLTDKLTIAFSNVHASKIPYEFDGKK